MNFKLKSFNSKLTTQLKTVSLSPCLPVSHTHPMRTCPMPHAQCPNMSFY
ncbi:MAG: hypothetical protein F6J93_23695 [Oscillatoria sp. SIO1A7]|nr:hypothetical protein [Oscillatoria sp. SIO1A7]